ncbi:inner membrane protein YcdZ [Salmonella enterica subsp. enterica serovar Choleraesuis str. 0006]|nr:inner membrane protein YcdZ [Salmonella enterica subsp. enterica serovar Choleraesuis str. 0006]
MISACTLLSGMVWALVIIHGSALAPHLEIVSYVLTGIVAFLMCIQAKQLLLLLSREHLSAPVRHLQGRVTGGWYYRRWRWG